MSKKLFIVGAGGLGRELHSWIQQHPDFNRDYSFSGFLDDNPDALKPFGNFAPVLPIVGHQVSADSVYLCGIGIPSMKIKLLSSLINSRASFISFIHPSSVVGERIKIGQGVIVCPGVSISADITIGSYSMIGPNTTIGHDAIIGEWCTLCAQCDITGHVVVGSAVFMGSRASIIPGKKIGSESIIGAGAVVITDVPSQVTVVGNPARIL